MNRRGHFASQRLFYAIDAWRRGTHAPRAARAAALAVLFGINRPIVGRHAADTLGDAKSRHSRLVIDHCPAKWSVGGAQNKLFTAGV